MWLRNWVNHNGVLKASIPTSTRCLLALCLALAVLVVGELIRPFGLTANATATPVAIPRLEPESEPIQFVPPPIHLFRAIVERPLFSPSRRPYLSSDEEVALLPEEVTIELVGVLITPTWRAALITTGTKDRAIWVRERAFASSWQVENIFADRIDLRRHGEVRSITLRRD